MKILFICGASRSVVWFRSELIDFLINKKNKIFVVACDDEFQNEIKKMGATFYLSKGNNRDIGIRSNLRYMLNIRKLVKKIEPDKIMTFQAKANTLGVIACKTLKKFNINSMVEGLGTVYNNNTLKFKIIRIISNILYKISFHKVNNVFFLNNENMQYFLKKHLVNENQSIVIPSIGINTEKYKQQRIRNDNIIKFVMVARVESDKGIYEYCEAAKRIISLDQYKVEFHYYGACDDRVNMILQYKKYVNYHGYTDDIISSLNDMDIFVLPSYHEGFPRSILEAMAMGKAIITSDIPGCNDAVKDGINGFLVAKKSIDDLCLKMIYLIDNPSLIKSMGKASREIVEKEFECNKINDIIYRRLTL